MNISNTFKKLSLSKNEKELVNAGFMTIDKNYELEVLQLAKEELRLMEDQKITDHINSDDFQSKLIKVAIEKNKSK